MLPRLVEASHCIELEPFRLGAPKHRRLLRREKCLNFTTLSLLFGGSIDQRRIVVTLNVLFDLLVIKCTNRVLNLLRLNMHFVLLHLDLVVHGEHYPLLLLFLAQEAISSII